MKEFAASTDKAAAAAEYFRGQLEFIAASRFGSIMIWGAIIGGIGEAFKKVVDNSIEMDSAIHRVSSAFIDVARNAQTI